MLNKNALELFLTMVNLWPIRFAILYAEKKYKQYNEIPSHLQQNINWNPIPAFYKNTSYHFHLHYLYNTSENIKQYFTSRLIY